MPATGVGGDLEHRVVAVGAQHAAGAQVDVALFAHGVIGAVALGRVEGVVEEGVGGFVAVHVGDADGRARLDGAHEVVTGADALAVTGVMGLAEAFGQHQAPPASVRRTGSSR